MAPRTGEQYLGGLADQREVWLDDERVTDVVTHPAFAGAAATMASLFDLQHARPEVHLAPWPGTADMVHVTHLIPRSPDDLRRRHAAIESTARRTMGFLGRSPDYLNVTLAGFAAMGGFWARNGNEDGARNLQRFHEDCARHDWAMTHAIIQPTVDKAAPDVYAGGGEVCVHKVGRAADGIVVRGARALATLAPFADEMFVYAGQPLPADAGPFALVFSVPMATPGLKVLCRDPYSSPLRGDVGADHFDHPFSRQFDEQDAMVIFDDVVVPDERVFLDGDVQLHNTSLQSTWTANVLQQTSIRAAVKLQLCWELAARMAEVVHDESPTTQQLLGELWTYAELTRAAVAAAEAGAAEGEGGAWFCDERPFWALRPTLPRWFPRAFEIIKLIGAHNLLGTPTARQLAHAELRPLIDRYYQGAAGHPAEERIRVFRAAWDLVGSGLGARGELYERFYLASAARTAQMANAVAARRLRAEPVTLLDEFLGSASWQAGPDGQRHPR